MAKGKGKKPPEKQVIVAGADGKLYKVDPKTGSLAALDRADPIGRHARGLLKKGVAIADVVPAEGQPDTKFIFYHLINLASFTDPHPDDE